MNERCLFIKKKHKIKFFKLKLDWFKLTNDILKNNKKSNKK